MVIDNIELKVVPVFANDGIKLNLLQAIKTDASIITLFMKWELRERPPIKARVCRKI